MLWADISVMINRLVTGLAKRIRGTISMATPVTEAAAKRPAGEELQTADSKRSKAEEGVNEVKTRPPKRKKVALLTVYSGKHYHGCQVQTLRPDLPTVEAAVVKGLLQAELITQQHVDDMSKMWFQRASRTDKGVSAAGQVFSLLMRMDLEKPVERINTHLPADVKVLAVKQATKNFDSKNSCSYRTYEYLTPTFAFAPVEEKTTESFRITDDLIQRINQVMQNFKGTHNFHNFTSRRKSFDPSSKRFMMSFEAGDPFVLDDMEFVVITVRGQSFMLHQIRKMIGLTIAIVRAYASEDTIELCWGPSKVDIPKAPGLGLLLDKLHYDGYNKRFGSDGVHEPIDWLQYKDEIQKFKMEHIYADIMKTEKEERSMFEWLTTLSMHSYETYVDRPRETQQSDGDDEKKKSSDNKTQQQTPTNNDAIITEVFKETDKVAEEMTEQTVAVEASVTSQQS